MSNRGTLRLFRLAVGYLTRTSLMPESQATEAGLSLGTAVAMNRNLLITARNNVVDPDTGEVHEDLAVGFLTRQPQSVEFVTWQALDIEDLVLLRLSGKKHLPLTLEIPELVGGQLLAGRRWLTVGFPKGVAHSRLFHLGGSIESACLSTGYAILAELKSDTPLEEQWSSALEGAPLYAEDPARGWPLAGFIADPPVRRVGAGPEDLYGLTPEGTEEQEVLADELDLAFARLADFQGRSGYRALSPDVRSQFLLDQLRKEFELHRSAPTVQEYRESRRRDRRNIRTAPARRSGRRNPTPSLRAIREHTDTEERGGNS